MIPIMNRILADVPLASRLAKSDDKARKRMLITVARCSLLIWTSTYMCRDVLLLEHTPYFVLTSLYRNLGVMYQVRSNES